MSKKIQSLSRDESNSLYRTLKFIHDTFVKKDISYFITGGTLLGAIRHGGPIFLDDDGDVCILRKDVPKLRKLVPYFEKNGYLLEEVENDDKGECRRSKNSCDWFVMQKTNPNAIGFDIFVMKTVGRKLTYANPYWLKADNGGVNCYFEKTLTFPLVPMRFGNFYVYVPNNSVEHLNRCYGEDWNDKVRAFFSHRTGEWLSGRSRKLKPNEFKAPNPPRDTCSQLPPKVVCLK